MEINIFNSSNEKEYSNLIERFNLDLDIYYYPEFLFIDASMQKGKYEVFTVNDGKNIFIYPYIKLSFEAEFQDLYDLSSPYGYCGPFCTDKSLFSKSEAFFLEYAANSGFVTEFVRYHYLYNKEFLFERNIENIRNRSIVLLPLNTTWEEIWASEFSGTNRNIVRKLEKEGFRVESSIHINHLDEFIELYLQTMKNVNADSFYFFNSAFYNDLFNSLNQKIQLIRVMKDNILMASALFFVSGGIVTYYLSGRNLNYPNIPATNLMLTEAVKIYKEKGLKFFNFGGGRTMASDDALLKFKKNFSKNSEEFFIGKRVHNTAVYNQVKSKYISDKGLDQYKRVKHLLQFYR